MPQPRTYRLRDLLDDGFAEARMMYDFRQQGHALGPELPSFPHLARELCGRLQGVTTLMGAPGAGKSALAGQIAAEAGCPALIVTCEMSPLELLRRHAARVTGTFLNKFRDGSMPPSEWLTAMRRTVETMPDLAVLDGTCVPVGFDDIRESAELIRGGDGGGHPHLLVVLDSLHAWVRAAGSGASEYDALNVAFEGCRALSANLQAPFLIVSEQNRTAMGSSSLHGGKGSSVVEYAGDVVATLTRSEEGPDVNGDLDIAFTLPKNRYGPPGGRIPLRFNGAQMRFSQADSLTIARARPIVVPPARKRAS